jgi:ATP-dependent helicase/DNAse subunit B
MVTNKFDCTKRKYVFELDFDFDNYPKVYSDDGYYTDNQIEKLQMNPSYIKTRIDDDKKQLFINYLEETSKLSMVEYALSKEVFASTYVDSLDMKVEEYKTLKVMNKSLAASKLTYKLNESSFKHSKTGDEIKELFKDIYKTEEEYDYSFKPFKYDNLPFSQTSFSSIDRYYECPFKFYCDKVLKIGEFASSGAIDVGSFIHKILESVFDKNFDLDVAFENALNCTELKISENRKTFFRAKIKDYVKILCNLLKNRYYQNKIKYYLK